MQDILTMVSRLKRPRSLVNAARFGIDDYRRDRDLPRLLLSDAPPRRGSALAQLMDRETALNEARLERAAHYTIARHIDVLCAVMCEARDLQAERSAAR